LDDRKPTINIAGIGPALIVKHAPWRRSHGRVIEERLHMVYDIDKLVALLLKTYYIEPSVQAIFTEKAFWEGRGG
jgi:hypothetical protein